MFYVTYGVDVRPSKYRRSSNFVKLIPAVELGDPADGTGWIFLVDQKCRLGENISFVSLTQAQMFCLYSLDVSAHQTYHVCNRKIVSPSVFT